MLISEPEGTGGQARSQKQNTSIQLEDDISLIQIFIFNP